MSKVKDYIESPEHHSEFLSLKRTQLEALLEVVALAIYADGVVAVEEVEVFNEVASELPILSNYSEDELDKLLQRATGRLQEITDPSSAASSLERIAKQLDTQDAREAAFGLAAVIVMSDGVVVQPEKNVLKRLARALSIPLRRLSEIAAEARAFLDEA